MEEKEIEENFREELKSLLEKYNAEIGLIQRGRAYMEYEVIEITIQAKYDKEGEVITPYVEFDL